MKSPLTPKEEAMLLVEQAQEVAEKMLADMEGEECVRMVRDYCGVMADWQPNIASEIGNPIMLGLHCLATAFLFQRAFVKAYENTDKVIKAQEAIKKALGGLE